MIADLKPYPAMKDSGVEWLGEVPGHWEVRRLKQVFQRIIGGATPASGESSFWDGEVVWITPADVSKRQRLTTSARTVTEGGLQACSAELAPSGSIIVTSRAPVGNVALAATELCTNQGCKSLITDGRVVDSEFGLVVMQTLKHELQSLATGTTFTEISTNKLGIVPFPLPSLPEQTAIVRFLDYVDRRIRRYIRAKQKLIGLLEEQKQAIIHQAVTRGLDPNVPLKPSGVEWLGDVPEHWDVRRLKHICRLAYGDSLPSGVRAEGDIPVYGSNGRVGFHSSSNATGPSLIIGRKGSFGKVNYSPDPVFAIDTTFFVDARNTNAEIRWLYYFLGWLQLDQVSKDSAVPGLDRGDAYQRIGLYPPLPEQTAIVEYLDKATADIDTTITRTNREIQLLREYRTRLIADVVTGKLDVREAVASLPEETEDSVQDSALDEVVETELPGEDAEHSHKEHNDDQQ